jgi:hypothetical protein
MVQKGLQTVQTLDMCVKIVTINAYFVFHPEGWSFFAHLLLGI